MQNQLLAVAFVVFVILAIQTMLTAVQANKLRHLYDKLCESYKYVSVGKQRKRGQNCIAVLAFTNEGVLSEAYTLSGLTVFSRPRRICDMDNLSCYEILEQYTDKKNNKVMAITEATAYMVQTLEGECC